MNKISAKSPEPDENIASGFLFIKTGRDDRPYGVRAERVTAIETLPFIVLFVLFINLSAHAFTTEASYYTVESCKREGTSGIMANGRRLVDEEYICASWDYSFGTRLKVTNLSNGKSCICEVSDRGPSKKLYKKGRKLDLSKAAFSAIAPLRLGVIKVEVK